MVSVLTDGVAGGAGGGRDVAAVVAGGEFGVHRPSCGRMTMGCPRQKHQSPRGWEEENLKTDKENNSNSVHSFQTKELFECS